MKRVLLILLFIPAMVLADCSLKTREVGKEIASYITSEISYNKNKDTFNIILDNVDKDIYIKYGKKEYHPKNEKIEIMNIENGETVTINVYYNKGCDDPVGIINKSIPYYNIFYGSPKCANYKDKLYQCSSQFTSYLVTKDVVDLAIMNYNKIPETPKKEETPVVEKTTKEIIIEFTNTWGIRIMLLILSSLITYLIYSTKYRKVVHGI